MSSQDKFDDIDYSYRFLISPKWFIGIISFFLLGVISYIPFAANIDSVVYSSLNISQNCQVRIKDYRFEFFAPKLILEKIQVPQGCFNGSLPQGLNIDDLKIYFRGISFSPLGVSAKAVTKVLNSNLEVFVIAGVSSMNIILESESKGGRFTTDINKISLENINEFFPQVQLSGDFYLSNVMFEMGYNSKIKKMILNIASNNLLIPSQSLEIPSPMGGGTFPLTLDDMPLNAFLFQATGNEKGKVKVEKFIIGDEPSPIRSKFDGTVNLNMRNIKLSMLDLKGELGFSKEFIEKFSILELALGKFDKKDNFYQIQLKGPLSGPRTSSPK